MLNRRTFCMGAAATIAGALVAGRGFGEAAAAAGQAGATRRPVMVGGRRVKTVDVHSHCVVPGVMEMIGQRTPANAALIMSADRVPQMDAARDRSRGAQHQSILVSAERDLARRLIATQNEKLSAFCAAHPDRFVGLATVALQHPDLAAEQLEEGMKNLGLRGVSIGASVNGEELSSGRFDPFWAKAEGLRATIFIHPQGVPELRRLQGNGLLTNVIGNPLDTTIALSHLIFGEPGSISRAQDLRGARRGLPPVVRGPIGSRVHHLPGAMHQDAQTAADRIPEAALFRFAGVHGRGPAASGRGVWRQSDRAGDRLSVSVDVHGGRSCPRRAGIERRRPGRNPGRQRRHIAEYRFVETTKHA